MKAKLPRLYAGLPIRIKIFLTTFVSSFLVIVVFSLYVLYSFETNLKTNAITVYENLIERIAKSVEGVYATREIEIRQLIYSREVNDFLKSRFTNDYQQYNYFRSYIEPQVNAYINTRHNSFIVYHNNPTITMSRYFTSYPSLTGLSNAQELLTDSSMRIQSQGIHALPKGNTLIHTAGIRDLKMPISNVGLFVHFTTENELKSLLSMEGEVSDNVVLWDGEQNLLASTKGLENVPLQHEQELLIGSERYYYIERELEGQTAMTLGWRVGYLIPFETLSLARSSLLSSLLFFILLLLVFSFVLSYQFSNNLNRRFSRLTRHMQELASGNLTDRIHVDSEDEIGQLYQSYNRTAENLNNLLEENHAAELKLHQARLDNEKAENAFREAQYRALQNQINPHYLFNTLESIRMRLVTTGDRELAAVVASFSETFRWMLECDSKPVSLLGELKFVKQFVAIQRFRFGSRLKFELACESHALLRCKVPSILLQPLVENSLYHGFNPGNGELLVQIRISRKDNDLHIVVEDNGTGIPADRLESIRREIHDQTDNSRYYALKNIYSRLEHQYGEGFEFSIDSNPGGTVVEIVILDTNRK